MCHEMQAIARLMNLTSGTAMTDTRERNWQVVRRKMHETMPQFAADAHFIDLLAFVVDMCGASSACLRDLTNFHSKFVNPQLRRLRLRSPG